MGGGTYYRLLLCAVLVSLVWFLSVCTHHLWMVQEESACGAHDLAGDLVSHLLCYPQMVGANQWYPPHA